MNTSISRFIYQIYAICFIPLGNCVLELVHLIKLNFQSILNYIIGGLLVFGLLASLGYYHTATRCLRWILLGVASSIGFGFGMHTFVLFLAPHIAAVTMAAHSCRSLDFPEPPYPDEIICPDTNPNAEVAYMEIMYKIALDSFMWGLGTAIGELPPYLAARLRARAMGRKFAGDSLSSESDIASWELRMIRVIRRVGFFGILLCAAIPNPLFDAAGVASGIAQVPFLSFFGATLIGKAIIKVSLQSSFVVLSFHKNNLDSLIQQLDKKLSEYIPLARDLKLNQSMTQFLNEQRNNVLRKNIDEPKHTSKLSTAFNWLIFACFTLFILSLINALDKQYRARKASKTTRKKN